jgi:hypothetical protein
MVYAPGHFQRATRRRYRTRRERLSVQAAAVIALALVGLVVFSLTSHQRRTGHGCIDFNYTTMIGGAETYACGGRARTLCASPHSGKSIDTNFTTALYAACRKAGIPTAHS